jgi:hypothetical protein
MSISSISSIYLFMSSSRLSHLFHVSISLCHLIVCLTYLIYLSLYVIWSSISSILSSYLSVSSVCLSHLSHLSISLCQLIVHRLSQLTPICRSTTSVMMWLMVYLSSPLSTDRRPLWWCASGHQDVYLMVYLSSPLSDDGWPLWWCASWCISAHP